MRKKQIEIASVAKTTKTDRTGILLGGSVAKGKCCGGVIKPSQPSQSTKHGTKAQQQMREAAAADAKKELQKLQKQNASPQKKLEAKGSSNADVFSMEEDDDMGGGSVVVVLTDEQLQARVDLYRSQGSAEDSDEVTSTLAKIEELRKAKLASKSGSEQRRKSERALKKAESNFDAARSAGVELCEKLAENDKDVGRLHLLHRETQRAHDELVASLRSSPEAVGQLDGPGRSAVGTPALEKLFCSEGAPPDAILEGFGEWGKLFKAIRDKVVEDRQKQVDEERRLAAKAAEDASKAEAEAKFEAEASAAALAAEAELLGNSEADLKRAIEKADPALRAEIAKRMLVDRDAKDATAKRAGPYKSA